MTTTLEHPPSLAQLYAKAAATGPLDVLRHRLSGLRGVAGPGGTSDAGAASLPDSVYELAPQAIDPGHLAGYDRVCGFRFGDALPATYLHVLSFPLQVALMTERAFPFPLVGLVHVANEITVHRRVDVGERVAFAVHAADLRPHPAGRRLDLVGEATVDGETVWSGRSTYLRRDGAAKPRPRPTGERGPKAVPEEPDASASLLRVPGDIGRRYAAVSGDRNPIHLSGLSAKLFGFPSAIAHGMWVKARTLATLEGRLPEAYTVRVAFKLPVLLPSTLRVTTTAADAPGGWELDVRSARSGKPHLAGAVTPRP